MMDMIEPATEAIELRRRVRIAVVLRDWVIVAHRSPSSWFQGAFVATAVVTVVRAVFDGFALTVGVTMTCVNVVTTLLSSVRVNGAK